MYREFINVLSEMHTSTYIYIKKSFITHTHTHTHTLLTQPYISPYNDKSSNKIG